MLAPITLKVCRAAMLAVVAVVMFVLCGCSSPKGQSLPTESTSEAESQHMPMDYCPNLPGVHTAKELPNTYEQVYSVEKGVECLPKEEARKVIAEMDRLYQEQLAKATVLVLGPQSAKMTFFDKLTKAVAYHCNRPGDLNAEIAAHLVYNSVYGPTPGVTPAGAKDFRTAVKAMCGEQPPAINTNVPPVADSPRS